jgi:hypothetical protein
MQNRRTQNMQNRRSFMHSILLLRGILENFAFLWKKNDATNVYKPSAGGERFIIE